MAKKNKAKNTSSTICLNKRAKFEYQIHDKLEAGLCLQGWEVKSLRDGRAQLIDSYITFKNGEAWLSGAHITPLKQASTHYVTEPRRERKLLLHSKQITHLAQGVEAKGFTCIAIALYWANGKVKCEVALGKGKKLHDKRATEKERDWNRQKQREMSNR